MNDLRAYFDIRSTLRTGDILLFSGKSLISVTIRVATRSPWSHVGMVWAIPEDDLLLCWESTSLSGIDDIREGRNCRGVQLVPLSTRLANYDGEVSVRSLECARTPEQRALLRAFRFGVLGRPYEGSKLELLRAAFRANDHEALDMLFCSELIAAAYQQVRLLPSPPDGPPANDYVPHDFAEGGVVEQRLRDSAFLETRRLV